MVVPGVDALQRELEYVRNFGVIRTGSGYIEMTEHSLSNLLDGSSGYLRTALSDGPRLLGTYWEMEESHCAEWPDAINGEETVGKCFWARRCLSLKMDKKWATLNWGGRLWR